MSPVITQPVAGSAGAPTEDFSLVLGGPLYQLFLRSHLIRPPFGNLGGRLAVIAGLAWLPLLPLTILDHRLAAGVRVPFLHDFEVQARLLFSLPLLILAELIVHFRMRAIAAQFIERNIVTDRLRPAFNQVLASAMRLRNSLTAEIVLLGLVVIAGPFVWRQTLALSSSTWYATVTAPGLTNPTAAGRWYMFVSVPIFQFILLRWYYRLFVWCRFLFQVSRLDLNLVPIHPDRCCGLGFLGNVAFAFAPILMAHSGLVSGYLANRILYENAVLPAFRFELAGMALFLLMIILGPLCVFVPTLNRARLSGLRTYGRLSSDYVVGFAAKWTHGPATEPLVGTADIQSLADLDNSFAIVKEMKVVPFGKDAIVRFLVIIAIPLLPLGLTMFSLDELLKRLITIVL